MALLNATEIATTGPVNISAPAKPAEAAGTGGTVIGEGRIGRQVRVPKTAELVAAHLRRQIVRGELVEGDALPPEAVLMEQFGVSRPTLREAFRVLESEALISVRRGAHGGARVHTPNGDVAARYAALVLEHRGTTLADIHQARALIEPPCVRQIAERHTDDDLTELRAALTAVEAADDNHSQLQAADTDFRGLLIELAGNQTLLVLAGMLRHIVSLAQGKRIGPRQHAGRAGPAWCAWRSRSGRCGQPPPTPGVGGPDRSRPSCRRRGPVAASPPGDKPLRRTRPGHSPRPVGGSSHVR
ncbi:FadR/GntR family transcriptional regulator [Frankia sp. Cr1]|uniref:FadR/GntR family transcriptional regulator n=1 Tax=Frankia sp. Cr1 TaxID=3073931 RepID=UPI002AD2A37B|nr:GntR family transcriptional regulator [Frankia sp. Cr1]